MAAHADLGTPTRGEEIAGSLLVQASSPDQGPDDGGDATGDHIQSPQKGRTVLEQFLQNLMLALSPWPI